MAHGGDEPWNPADAAKVRAWSASFGAGPPPEDRPNSASLHHFTLSKSGRTFHDIQQLCDSARELARPSTRRPVTAPAARKEVVQVQYNDPTAFVNGIPGYQGYRPRVRKPYNKGPHALCMATVNARAYVKPSEMPKFKRHAPPAWELTEYRKVCYTNIGKGSPYVKDLHLAGNPLE